MEQGSAFTAHDSRFTPVAMMAAAMLTLAAAATAAQKPIEIDRTLQRVHGTPIMASDVRQARLLRLVDAAATDDEILRALENRLLVLHETARNERIEPKAEAIQARRKEWASAWPAGTDLPALLARAGATDQWLDGWIRDELRIAAYLDQRFGRTAERAMRIETWLNDLRRRANLIVKIG
jgi:hypothetical protein